MCLRSLLQVIASEFRPVGSMLGSLLGGGGGGGRQEPEQIKEAVIYIFDDVSFDGFSLQHVLAFYLSFDAGLISERIQVSVDSEIENLQRSNLLVPQTNRPSVPGCQRRPATFQPAAGSVSTERDKLLFNTTFPLLFSFFF